MGCVYLITNVASGKCYIGQTTQHDFPDLRWHRHCRSAKNGSHYPLHRAIREHGAEAFTVETIFITKSQNVLNTLESLYAMEYHAYVPFGYNDAVAGKTNRFAGKKHTEESRRKMREAKRRFYSATESSEPDIEDVSDESNLYGEASVRRMG